MYKLHHNIFVGATLHLTKPETRSNMAGRSESHKGKKEEPYGEKGDSSMKNLNARMLLGKAMTILKESSKSKKITKCMREAEKFTSFNGFQAVDDANTDAIGEFITNPNIII